MNDFGTKVKSRREELNLSQDFVAEKMGYKGRSSIQKIESGKQDIPQSKIFKLAEVLKTTPAYLMGWTDSSITQEEADHVIDRYRTLSKDHRDLIRDTIDRLAEMDNKSRK